LDSKVIRKLADFLAQCVMANEQIEVRNILDDCHENKKLLIKLPRWIQKD
jgi:hypothetical protein